jgi:hypothetical protein
LTGGSEDDSKGNTWLENSKHSKSNAKRSRADISTAKQHTNLTTHSPYFTVAGGTSYLCDVQGTIVDGGVSLEMLVNGAFVPLPTPIHFTPFTVGGSQITGLIPANSVLRWTVPGNGNNISCKITSSHN